MTTHRAKTAALLAYSEGLLSDAGVRRIEAHLRDCDVCQRELRSIELYDRMLDDVHETDVPELDFSRMEQTLAKEADRISREIGAAAPKTSNVWWPWAVGGLAAAAALLLWLGSGPAAPEPVAQRPAPPEAPSAPVQTEPADLAPQLTLTAGIVEQVDGDAVAPAASLAPGQSLAEGDRLRVEGLAHVRLDRGLGFVLGSAAEGERAAELELARADVEEVRLVLDNGRVDSTVADDHVEGWQRQSSFVVLAGRYEVRARGPVRFVTAYIDGELTVGVHAGRLTVNRDGNEVARLEAPGQWSSRPGALLDPAAPRPPRGLSEAITEDDATPLTLSHPRLVRWSVDGAEVAHPGPVQLRVRAGTHRVTGWTAEGRAYEHTLEAVGTAAMIDEGALRVDPPLRMRAGHLDPQVIAEVVGRGQRSFQQCWRRSLREHTEAQQGTLRVTIGSLGDVSRVRVTGLTGPGAAELRECITNYARRWEFPPPGGPVTFNQPLRFSSSM